MKFQNINIGKGIIKAKNCTYTFNPKNRAVITFRSSILSARLINRVILISCNTRISTYMYDDINNQME